MMTLAQRLGIAPLTPAPVALPTASVLIPGADPLDARSYVHQGDPRLSPIPRATQAQTQPHRHLTIAA